MKWFREPKVIECCREGDHRRFLCVAERRLNEITGGMFVLTGYREVEDENAIKEGEKMAWRQAYERAKAGEWIAEGSLLRTFDWPLEPGMEGMTAEEFKVAVEALP